MLMILPYFTYFVLLLLYSVRIFFFGGGGISFFLGGGEISPPEMPRINTEHLVFSTRPNSDANNALETSVSLLHCTNLLLNYRRMAKLLTRTLGHWVSEWCNRKSRSTTRTLWFCSFSFWHFTNHLLKLTYLLKFVSRDCSWVVAACNYQRTISNLTNLSK